VIGPQRIEAHPDSGAIRAEQGHVVLQDIHTRMIFVCIARENDTSNGNNKKHDCGRNIAVPLNICATVVDSIQARQ
jgi:hypothetical protein